MHDPGARRPARGLEITKIVDIGGDRLVLDDAQRADSIHVFVRQRRLDQRAGQHRVGDSGQHVLDGTALRHPATERRDHPRQRCAELVLADTVATVSPDTVQIIVPGDSAFRIDGTRRHPERRWPGSPTTSRRCAPSSRIIDTPPHTTGRSTSPTDNGRAASEFTENSPTDRRPVTRMHRRDHRARSSWRGGRYRRRRGDGLLPHRRVGGAP